jgi:hypothetical protein
MQVKKKKALFELKTANTMAKKFLSFVFVTWPLPIKFHD